MTREEVDSRQLKVEKEEKTAVACEAKRRTEACHTNKKERRQDAGGTKQKRPGWSRGALFNGDIVPQR